MNKRLEELRAELDRIVPLLIKEYAPEAVYVYGSVASGHVSEWSDLDLVIIKSTTKRFLDRIADILKLIKPQVGMDIVVYTPDEWSALCQKQGFVQTEIAQKGRCLYAA